MKYVSLIEVMRLYGIYVKKNKTLLVMWQNAFNRTYEDNNDYSFFEIIPEINEETGQICNTLEIKSERYRDFNQGYVRTEDDLKYFTMPPIMELEWLRRELDLTDEYMNILVQLGYAFIAHVMVWVDKSKYRYPSSQSWMDYLEEKNAIMEVEELEDTPKILTADPLKLMAIPKTRSWQYPLIYAGDFRPLFSFMTQQSVVTFKLLYYQMPVMLALFMCNFYANKLSDWSKHSYIEMENEISDQIQSIEALYQIRSDAYTYGQTTITSADNEFVRYCLTCIREKIHTISSDIGTISWGTYRNVRGPEIVHAQVRLSCMDINWKREMDRAEAENKQDSETESGHVPDNFFEI